MSLLRIIGASCLCGVVGIVACSGGDEVASEQASNEELPGEDAVYADEHEEGEALTAALKANPEDPATLAWQEHYNARADERAGLFMTLEVEPGHEVKFYDPGDGTKLITETSKLEHERVLTEKGVTTSYESAYRAVRPGDEVPQEVLDADARTPESDPMLAQQGPESVGLEPVGDIEAVQNHGDGLVEKHVDDCAHFEDGHGLCPSGDQDWCVCNPPWQGNGGPFGFTNTTHSFHAVGAITGPFLVTLKGGNSTFGPFSVAQGNNFVRTVTSNKTTSHCGWLEACNSRFALLTHTVEVHNASTDTLFWGACFDGGQTFDCP